MPTLRALARYFTAILQDGDYANDWRTHVPRALRPIVERAGRALALALEQSSATARSASRMVADVVSCGDPTLPAHAHAVLLPLWHTLTRLYDALLTLGVC